MECRGNFSSISPNESLHASPWPELDHNHTLKLCSMPKQTGQSLEPSLGAKNRSFPLSYTEDLVHRAGYWWESRAITG